MCGIAGIFRPGGRVLREELEAMAAALSHRGPDGTGVWVDGEIGLCHTRLAIIDLSERASQPMASQSGAEHIVFNGEIYNFRRVRSAMEAKGVAFRSTSDTEVLLESLARDGEHALRAIEGMFAFALWDAKTRTLLLARDRAGEKPMYYLPLAGGGVAFASEVKALRAVAALGVERDTETIPEFLLYGYVPPPRTCWRGVLALPPAHVVAFRAGHEAPPRRYWSASFDGSRSRLGYTEAKRELRSRMRDIVRDRLESSDVPVGAFLSGGLDSATIVGVASRDLGRTIHTYSIGFDDPEMDESADAAISARHLGSIHEEFRVGREDLPSVARLVHHYDGPFADSSAFPTYLVSRMARKRVTVAVTGDGGDELFGGYPRFIGGMLAEALPRGAGRLGKGLSRLAGSAVELLGQKSHQSTLARAQRFGAVLGEPLEARLLAWNGFFPPSEVARLVTSGRAATGDLGAYSNGIFAESRGQSALARMLHHNFRSYLPEDLLVKVDRCAMAVSLETRSPFLDSGLVGFVGGLPDACKIRGFRTKRILRDTFVDLLAPELRSRPKRGFSVPLARWLDGPLRAEWRDVVLDPRAEVWRHLDRDAVTRTLWSAPLDAARAQRTFCLWTLQTWLSDGADVSRADAA